jgi:hypothetical protein
MLRAVLGEAPAGGVEGLAVQTRRMAELTDKLRNGADAPIKLREPLRPDALSALIRRSERADFTDLRVMSAWLQTPWPTAKERLALWAAWGAAAAAVDARHSDAPAPPPWQEQVGLAAQQRQALLRARCSIDLLRLRGRTDLHNLEETLARTDRLPMTLDRFRDLSGALRQAWKQPGRDGPGLNRGVPR